MLALKLSDEQVQARTQTLEDWKAAVARQQPLPQVQLRLLDTQESEWVAQYAQGNHQPTALPEEAEMEDEEPQDEEKHEPKWETDSDSETGQGYVDIMDPRDLENAVFRVLPDSGTLGGLQICYQLEVDPKRLIYVVRRVEAPAEQFVLFVVSGSPFVYPGVPTEIAALHLAQDVPHVNHWVGWSPLQESADQHGRSVCTDYAFAVPWHYSYQIPEGFAGNLVLIRDFMRQLLTAVDRLQQKNLLHNDIRLENLHYDPVTRELVLIDLDRTCTPFNLIQMKPGDEYYAPPEKLLLYRALDEGSVNQILRTSAAVSFKSDAYACGVVLSALLQRSSTIKEPQKLRRWRKQLGKLKAHMPPESDLMCGLLHGDPDHRLSAAEALEHPFFHTEFHMSHLADYDMFRTLVQSMTPPQLEHAGPQAETQPSADDTQEQEEPPEDLGDTVPLWTSP